MEPHVHLSAVTVLFILAAVFAVSGTVHLLALTYDNRLTRALTAVGVV